MSLYISIILVFLALLFKRSKFVSILLFIFIWTLWGWNSWNGDYDAYLYHFNNVTSYLNSSEYEIGYTYLVYYLKFFLDDYQTYQILISFFLLSTILHLTLKYSKSPALYSAIYFFLFVMEFVFIRNYIAHTLILTALVLGFEQVKNYKLWMIILLVISSLIHSSTIIAFTLLIPFFSELKVWNFKKSALIFILYLIFVFLLFNIGLSYLGGSFLSKFTYYKTGHLFSNVFFVHLLVVVLMIVYYYNLLKVHKSNITLKDKRLFTILININIISLSYLAFYMQIPYFGRFLRFLFTFNLLFLTYSLPYFYKTKFYYKSKLIVLTIVLLILVLFFKSTLSLTFDALMAMNKIWGEKYYDPSSKIIEKERDE